MPKYSLDEIIWMINQSGVLNHTLYLKDAAIYSGVAYPKAVELSKGVVKAVLETKHSEYRKITDSLEICIDSLADIMQIEEG